MVLVGFPGVGRQEFRPTDDFVDHGRDVVIVTPRPKETEAFPDGVVPGQEPFHVPLQVSLGRERFGKVHAGLYPDLFGDVAEKIIDAVNADIPEHGLPDAGLRIGNIGVNSFLALHG